MGLLLEINKVNRYPYRRGTLTLDTLMSAIKTLYHNRPISRGITIRMGIISYLMMEFVTSLNFAYPKLRYWTYVPKNVKNRFIYITFFQKHSLYKMKLYIDKEHFKYELFYGTTSLGLGDSIYCINNLIELKKAHENLS